MKQTITAVVPPTDIPGRLSAPWRDLAMLHPAERAASPEETITRLVERAKAETDCDAVAAVYDNRFVTSVNLDICPFPECSDAHHLHALDGPGRFALDHEPVRIDDTRWPLRWSRWAKRAAAQGFLSAVSVGLRSTTHTFGTMTLLKRVPRGFTLHDVMTVTRLADDAALALEEALAERELVAVA